MNIIRPRAIVIAASTGGPQALATLFSGLGPMIDEIQVFVVLHMPAQFTEIVSNQIERISRRRASAARDNEIAAHGHIYIAPGGCHLRLEEKGLSTIMRLDDGPHVNFCKPSADILFSSAAEVFGSQLVSIVLSGMGSDGCEGARKIAHRGGKVIAQDKETSAVWGMPAAVVEAGIASAVLPVDCIAGHLALLFNRKKSGAAA